MNIFEFMSGSPWLSFLLAWLIVCIAYATMRYTYRCWNRLLRHLNIRKAGWPPAHLDADGDFKPAPKVES